MNTASTVSSAGEPTVNPTVKANSTSQDSVNVVHRAHADRTARRCLFLDPDGPKQSVFGARRAFGIGIWISGIRCVITYLLIPFVGPVLGLAGIGPEIGLVASAVSLVALFFGVRRFFAADHRMRWRYLALASAVSLLLIVEAVRDISHLVH